MILGLGLILLLILGAVAIAPKRPSASVDNTPRPMFMNAPTPQPSTINFREQMLAEEAAEVSAAYREAANKKWREELITKATTILTP